MLRIGHLTFFFISALTYKNKCKFIPKGMAGQLFPNNRYIFLLKQYEVKHFPAINPSHFYLLLGGS